MLKGEGVLAHQNGTHLNVTRKVMRGKVEWRQRVAERGIGGVPPRIYLIRGWYEGEKNGRAVWRFSVEGIAPRERYGFRSLEDLIGFLQRQFGKRADRP